ncbi:MAG: YCF48-related protein [Candidatus Cloacimonetes bacterium]|nr:YCF48-related protein [Candidatus Cloacimonadota bacterium]
MHATYNYPNFEIPYSLTNTRFNLTPGAIYYVRAYAKNSSGEVWGNEVSFTMLPMLWDVIDTGLNNVLNKVHFDNANEGWICGSQGLILKTTNGGTTWRALISGTSSWLIDMHWIDAENAWIIGCSNDIVLKTVNGGISWQQVNLGFTPANGLRAIYFEDITTGYIMTNYGAVYKTNDAGISWRQIRSIGEYTFQDIWSSGDTIILAGQGLLRSTDGGLTWQSQLNTNDDYNSIRVQSPNTMWICGGGDNGYGKMYKSENLGANWVLLPGNISKRLNDIGFAPIANKIWTVGDYGAIYYSGNEGNDWNINYNQLSSTMFKSIFAIDDQKVWIVGDSGTILKLK